METQGDVLPTLRDDPVSIRDDDHPGAISLSLSQGPTTVAESSGRSHCEMLDPL